MKFTIKDWMVPGKICTNKSLLSLQPRLFATSTYSELFTASVALRAKLEETPMSAPEIDVVANVDVKVHKDKEAIIEALASQAAGAVQWVKTIQAFKEMGVTHIVECGPGRVLAGLIKRIDSSIVVKNINSQDSLVAVLEEINAAE